MNEASTPTLELQGAALRRPGATSAPALSLSSAARQVGLVGDWSLFLLALTGQAHVAAGSARVLGCDLQSALEQGVLGLGLCDAPVPGSFTVTEYLQHGARLSHGSAARAVTDTKQALDRFGLHELASRPLSQTTLFQQRAVTIALASIANPPLIWLESPLRGLDAAAADYVARLCTEAARHSRVILSAPVPTSTGPERSLFERCEDLFWLERGQLVAVGPAPTVFAANGRYSVRVTGASEAAYASALRDAGCQVTPLARTGDYVVVLPPDGNTDVLLDTALDQAMIVLELEPVLSVVPV